MQVKGIPVFIEIFSVDNQIAQGGGTQIFEQSGYHAILLRWLGCTGSHTTGEYFRAQLVATIPSAGKGIPVFIENFSVDNQIAQGGGTKIFEQSGYLTSFFAD